jgi:hypothetical protein
MIYFPEKDDLKLRNAWKTIWSLLKNDQGDYFTNMTTLIPCGQSMNNYPSLTNHKVYSEKAREFEKKIPVLFEIT